MMMRKRTRNAWFTALLFLGLSIVILEMDYLVPMSPRLHQLLLVVGIIMVMMTGAIYMYQRAKLNDNADKWWQDDDWTHWGGI
jgi:hypothetical protein